VHSDQRADDCDAITDDVSGFHDKTTKIKKCCVSFKLSSPGLACSCSSASAENTNVRRVSDAGHNVSEKNEGFVADMLDVHDDNLLQSVNSESPQPQSHRDEPCELVTRKAGVMKPECQQSTVSELNELPCNRVSLEHFAALDCGSGYTSGQNAHVCPEEVSMPHSVIAIPENISGQCVSNSRVSEKSDGEEGSSLLMVSSLKASQDVRSSGVQNASASDDELNFSYMDEELLACFTHSDSFHCELYSSEKENVCDDVESATITTSNENVESRVSPIGSDDDATTLCQALSAVKIAVAESVKSGATDFTLPESQYGDIIRLKVTNEDNSISTVDKDVVEEMAHSIGSSSLSLPRPSQLSQSSTGQQSTHRLQQQQWYATACSA